jgi:hypothetical protein
MERAYRIDITAKAPDGAWFLLVWNHTDPGTGNRHESAAFWSYTLGEARRVWQQLDAGHTPKDLAAPLSGWAGLVVSGVQVWRRFRRADGWGPWERHAPAIEGTHELRMGVCAPGADQPAVDFRTQLGLPAVETEPVGAVAP